MGCGLGVGLHRVSSCGWLAVERQGNSETAQKAEIRRRWRVSPAGRSAFSRIPRNVDFRRPLGRLYPCSLGKSDAERGSSAARERQEVFHACQDLRPGRPRPDGRSGVIHRIPEGAALAPSYFGADDGNSAARERQEVLHARQDLRPGRPWPHGRPGLISRIEHSEGFGGATLPHPRFFLVESLYLTNHDEGGARAAYARLRKAPVGQGRSRREP